MGEPTTPSPAERVARRNLARDIVQSVVEDEDMPLPPVLRPARGPVNIIEVELLVFQLAQEIDMLRDELDPLTKAHEHCDRFIKAEQELSERMAKRAREAHELLGITYPGLCNDEVWGGDYVDGIKALIKERDDLSAECHGRRYDPNLVRETKQLKEQLAAVDSGLDDWDWNGLLADVLQGRLDEDVIRGALRTIARIAGARTEARRG